MITKVLILILGVIAYPAFAQVTDSDIVRLSLGKNFSGLHPTLDSLKLWYHMHIDNNKANKNKGIADYKRIYSIEDGKGTVKVYAFKLDERSTIEEIIINYRHDIKDHVEDSKKLGRRQAFMLGSTPQIWFSLGRITSMVRYK